MSIWCKIEKTVCIQANSYWFRKPKNNWNVTAQFYSLFFLYKYEDYMFSQRLAGATLLVFANKQDLPGALSSEEIRQVSPILQKKETYLMELSQWNPFIKKIYFSIFFFCIIIELPAHLWGFLVFFKSKWENLSFTFEEMYYMPEFNLHINFYLNRLWILIASRHIIGWFRIAVLLQGPTFLMVSTGLLMTLLHAFLQWIEYAAQFSILSCRSSPWKWF